MSHDVFSNTNAVSGIICFSANIFDYLAVVIVVVIYGLYLVLKVKSQSI